MSRRSKPAHYPSPETLATAESIARRITEAREAQGLTKAEVGRRLGITRFTVAAVERGNPSTSLGVYVAVGQVVGLRVGVGAVPHASTEDGR